MRLDLNYAPFLQKTCIYPWKVRVFDPNIITKLYGRSSHGIKDYLHSYFRTKRHDCILYSEDGVDFKVHKEIFSQTKFMRELLSSAKGMSRIVCLVSWWDFSLPIRIWILCGSWPWAKAHVVLWMFIDCELDNEFQNIYFR